VELRSPRCVAALALTPVLVLLLIGCGASGAGEHPRAATVLSAATPAALSVVRAAAGQTLASSAGVEFSLKGSRAFGPSPAPVLGSGEFDFPAASGSETIDLGEVAHQEPGTEHVIFLPSRVYLQPKSPGSSVLPKGRGWVSANLAGADSVRTNFPSFVLQVEGVDPRFLLAELARGAVSAVPLGPATINGERARAYEVTVDLARALSFSAKQSQAVFSEAIQTELAAPGPGQSGGAQITSLRVWVDAAGYVVQLVASPPGAGVGVATMTMCCFGSPVEVSAPPPSQVVDITSLTPSGERENNGGGDSDGG
jgi:hypothetical protein